MAQLIRDTALTEKEGRACRESILVSFSPGTNAGNFMNAIPWYSYVVYSILDVSADKQDKLKKKLVQK